MSKLFYAFHYESGLHTTYASNTSKTAGFVRAYASKALRDQACNDYKSSWFKQGLLEIINGSTTSKSFMDRPIDRLVSYDLIERNESPNAATRGGEARVTYQVSKLGNKFLKSCHLQVN